MHAEDPMTIHDLGPPRPTIRPTDPPVRVCMDGLDVVVRVAGALDRDATNALAVSMNAAIMAGGRVLLDLDPVADLTPLQEATVRDPRMSDASGRPHVEAIGPGLIRIPTASRRWTVDVSRRRLCTTDDPTDRRFVPPQAWRWIRSLSVSSRAVVAIGSTGDVISTRAALAEGSSDPSCAARERLAHPEPVAGPDVIG
jgi:hypothetical protein